MKGFNLCLLHTRTWCTFFAQRYVSHGTIAPVVWSSDLNERPAAEQLQLLLLLPGYCQHYYHHLTVVVETSGHGACSLGRGQTLSSNQ